jgi:hypothetical protein
MKKKNFLAMILLNLVLLAGCGGSGGGDGSSSSSGDTTAPSIPANLTGNADLATQTRLSWDASSDNVGVVGYKLYRDGSLLANLSSSTTRWYVDAGLNPGTKYSYTVSAYDAAGNESGKSAAAEVTTHPARVVQFGTPADDLGYALTADGSGNVFVAGYTTGNLNGANAGQKDIFLAKYDSSKARQWVRQLGTTADEVAYGVGADSSGNVYVAGYTEGGLGGEANSGGADAFLAKYDPAGNLLWTRLLGTADKDWALGLAVDGSGNAYMTGYTYGNMPGWTNQGEADIFVAKFDTAGTRQWVAQLGTAGMDEGNGVAVDGTGNIYVTGFTEGSLDGTNVGGSDIFLAKYDTSGNQLWVKQLGSPGTDWAWAVAVDGSGNPYITGYTKGNLDGTNQGNSDIFLAKYNPSGTLVWLKQLGTSGMDDGYGIAVDGDGNAYVTGGTQGVLGENVNRGSYDIFWAKYDASGNQQWVRQGGTAGEDVGVGLGVFFDSIRNLLYVAGYTAGGFDGNASLGGFDALLVKLDSNAGLQ